MSYARKAEYVRQQRRRPSAVRLHRDAGDHHCHWPGCERKVPPVMWGCNRHWFMLPAHLRAKIWRTFRPGQEISKTPSADYIAAASEVQQWILQHQRGT